MELLSQYVLPIFVPFAVAILAIAFPLLLQAIARIDDKYSSTLIANIFYKECESRVFIYSIITTLSFIFLWMIKLPRLGEYGFLNDFIDQSAVFFLAISIITVIISLLLVVKKIRKYYSPALLLKHFLIKYEKYSTNKDLYLAISDLLYYSIQQQNEELARELYEFFSNYVIVFRKDKPYQVIVYPDEYYTTIFEANEQLALRKNKTISYFNNSSLLNLFLDDYQNTLLSEKTYSAIWMSLRQAVENSRDDIVMAYWETAHQHYSFFLQTIDEKYNNGKLINNDLVEEKNHQRERFLEFHYALGGLLFKQKRYSLLGRIINFTNQRPIRYYLFPVSISYIIIAFIAIQEPLINPFHFEQRYSFPEISGVFRGEKIKYWIRKYLIVLFLREYIHQMPYVRNAFELPSIPSSLPEISDWKQQLEYLKKMITDVLINKEALMALEFPDFNDAWFEENKQKKPMELIDELIIQTQKKYDLTKKTQTVSKEKEKAFKEKTKEIVLKSLNDFQKINNQTNIESDHKSYFFGGFNIILDKAGFAENQDISYLNSDTIAAQGLAINYAYDISLTFSFLPYQHFLLNDKDVFAAIDILCLNPKEHVIICFGIYLKHYIEFNKIKGLTQVNEDHFEYNHLDVLNFNYNNNDLVRDTFFILRRDELPSIIHHKIKEEIVKKYELEEIDNDTHLSASLINLNKRDDLKEEIKVTAIDAELDRSVLVFIALSTEIRWKNQVKCVSIKVYNQFFDRTNSNKLNEIKPFN